MKTPSKHNRVKDRVCIKDFRNEYDELIPKGTLIEVVTYGPGLEWDFRPNIKGNQPCGQIICDKEMVYKTHKKYFKVKK